MNDNTSSENQRRLIELAKRSYETNSFTFTDFLSMAELSDFYEIESVLGYACPTLYGGCDMSERKMIRFGDPDEFGYEQPFPIDTLIIEPLNEKFSDDLNHRDYLGSIMNLGIERDQIGDILAGDKEAYIFATPDIAQMMEKELIRIRHTSVSCSIVNTADCDIEPKFEEISGSVASERIDAILAFVYHLSRSEAQKLIESESVFIDGRTAYSGGYDLKEGARVSVRGHGKFIYLGTSNTTRKGRLFISVKLFK